MIKNVLIDNSQEVIMFVIVCYVFNALILWEFEVSK